MNNVTAALLGSLVAVGLALGGYFVGSGFVDARALERTVEVKGLAEREVPADTAIWPIQYVVAGNDLQPLLVELEQQGEQVRAFLTLRGFAEEEISVGAPNITDRQAQGYGDPNARLRYSVSQVVTVFTTKIDAVRGAGRELLELGKAGIVLNQDNYEFRTQYLFNGLNDIKPGMIEQATRKAREVAQKFAEDSNSRLGKIRTARQGQFSIADRDSNNPHIKNVRVVSTLEYYLAD
ncbi:MAG: SIMPL domain-containing protein [Gammaproteobacteria bacterium]|nr:SIMPL domain-containing protein [Gammaproteobacteria bacterium]